MNEKQRKSNEEQGRARKSKEEQGRARKSKEEQGRASGVITCGVLQRGIIALCVAWWFIQNQSNELAECKLCTKLL
jgi:hypothetical protein